MQAVLLAGFIPPGRSQPSTNSAAIDTRGHAPPGVDIVSKCQPLFNVTMAIYFLNVNGRKHRVDSWDPNQPLLHVLRNALGLHGTKFGCGLGQCGGCTVLIDGAPARSCTIRVADAAGKRITTIEGLGTPEKPHPVQAAFIAEQAAQCGYCTSGMVMSAVALLRRTPDPSVGEIKSALEGNLCRCGSHDRVIRAIRRAAAKGST